MHLLDIRGRSCCRCAGPHFVCKYGQTRGCQYPDRRAVPRIVYVAQRKMKLRCGAKTHSKTLTYIDIQKHAQPALDQPDALAAAAAGGRELSPAHGQNVSSLQLPAPFRLHEHILILGALVAGCRQPSPRSLTPPWAMEGTAPPPSPTTSSGHSS